MSIELTTGQLASAAIFLSLIWISVFMKDKAVFFRAEGNMAEKLVIPVNSITMKKIGLILSFALFFLSITCVAQTDTPHQEGQLIWYTDITKANEVSKATNRPLFAFFTGSDWCVWCKRLQDHVFSKPAFVQWANKNVVLVELDFPRYKQLSPEQQQQNSSLQQTFQVRGYPTVWLFFLNKNKEGTGYGIEALGSLGYPAGAEPGKEEVKFIQDAGLILARRETK